MPTSPRSRPAQTLALTCLALVAFAGNSVLCRLALGEGAIDGASFTVVRLLAGAITLALLCRARTGPSPRAKASWKASLVLFGYAICFSFAYTSLETGSGALILFGSVQLTMLLAAVLGGQRIAPVEWLGVLVALAGFVYLVLPGVSAPAPVGTLLMAMAGIGWGIYTLLGRGSSDALGDNARNFVGSLPLLGVLALVTLGDAHLTRSGVALAATSGAITSGLGYTLWYLALRGLSTTTAAVVQLSVPIIAAGGGVLFMQETISERLLIAAALILGGIALVVLASTRPIESKSE